MARFCLPPAYPNTMALLSNALIQTAQSDKRERVLWDDRVSGFGVRVKPSGVASFLIQYRNENGRSRRLTLGKFGVLSVSEARDLARRKLGEAAAGDDPARAREQRRDEITINALADRFMREHCARRCKPSTRRAYEWILKKLIRPAIGSRRLSDLHRSDVIRFHQSLAETPYNANRALQLLKSMLARARHWELVEESFDPARGVALFHEKKRERFLSDAELARLMTTIETMKRDGAIMRSAHDALFLLIFTGCRVGEILTLRWEQVDFDRRILSLPRHKTDQKGTKRLPLSPQALAFLAGIPKGEGSPFVCPGRDGGHLVNLQKPWRRVREYADLGALRLHDLRHTFASLALSQGAPLAVIGGLLGHETHQSTARYAHLSDEALIAATMAMGRRIADLRGQD